MTRSRTVAFNLLYIEQGNLTGPGYYAVQLFEHCVALALKGGCPFALFAYVQPSARHHFREGAQAFLRDVPMNGRRIKRVLFEQVVLPFRARRDRVDLLFSPAFVSPLWGAPALAVTICDMYYRVIPEAVERFQRRYWSLMIPLSAKACARVITISDSSKRDIERFIPETAGKVVSTPLASRMSADTVAVAVDRPNPFALIVANLTPNKNPGIVVTAVAALRAEGRAIDLVHVGKDHLGLLAHAVARHDATDFVDSLGKVSDAELAGLYRACLCVVVPSLYEGFGMPAVEAQTMGAPLVSSDRGALPEAGGEGALYFDPHDADALAGHLRRLLDEPGYRAKIARKGDESARRFSWQQTAERTLAVFTEIMEEQDRGRH